MSRVSPSHSGFEVHGESFERATYAAPVSYDSKDSFVHDLLTHAQRSCDLRLAKAFEEVGVDHLALLVGQTSKRIPNESRSTFERFVDRVRRIDGPEQSGWIQTIQVCRQKLSSHPSKWCEA